MNQKLQPLIVGFALDLVDWLGLGMAPFIADIIDIFGIVYFWRVLGVGALVGALELIPLFDGIPVFTALGAYAYMKKRR